MNPLWILTALGVWSLFVLCLGAHLGRSGERMRVIVLVERARGEMTASPVAFEIVTGLLRKIEHGDGYAPREE